MKKKKTRKLLDFSIQGSKKMKKGKSGEKEFKHAAAWC
jgi:hypothetical protein